MASPSKEDPDQAYVDGHRAGYGKGFTDGSGAGYSDAKLRAYNALDAMEKVGKEATVALREALEMNLGKR